MARMHPEPGSTPVEDPMQSSLRLALAACVLAAVTAGARPAGAGEPGVRAELYNGMARITLEGS